MLPTTCMGDRTISEKDHVAGGGPSSTPVAIGIGVESGVTMAREGCTKVLRVRKVDKHTHQSLIQLFVTKGETRAAEIKGHADFGPEFHSVE